jgi:hypothetical protein
VNRDLVRVLIPCRMRVTAIMEYLIATLHFPDHRPKAEAYKWPLVFEEIARLSFPGLDHRGLLLMLAAYFDDSGTHDNSRVVVWGGFITTAEKWTAFDAAWRAKLNEPLPGKPSLQKFGLSKCQALDGEFKNYTRAESDLVQNEFRQIIVDHELLGVAYAIDRLTWDRIVPDTAKAYFGGDAEAACFSPCFAAAIERARKYWPDELMLSLHFDKGRRSPKLNTIIDRVERDYRGAPALTNISFDVVEGFTPLQAADIIATENYWHAQGVIDGNPQPRPHFAHFLQRVSTEGFIAQETEILETLRIHGFVPKIISSGDVE